MLVAFVFLCRMLKGKMFHLPQYFYALQWSLIRGIRMSSDKEKEEARISVEMLRLISFLVKYSELSNLLTVFVFIGFTIVVVVGVLSAAELISSPTLVFGAAYSGMFLIFAYLWYHRKMRKRFNKYMEEASLPVLIRSSEYEELVEESRNRLEYIISDLLSEREHRISSMEAEIAELAKTKAKLEERVKELKEKTKK